MDNELGADAGEQELWRGVDLSGITAVLGVGGGRLIQALARQAAATGGGRVVAVGYDLDQLNLLRQMTESLPISAVNARPRQIPLLDGTVDLLVMSGVLRQVPEPFLGAMFDEVWRVLVPGGQLRISDIMEPSEADYNQAWRRRNRLVEKLGATLGRPTALYVNLKTAAAALREVGFENLAVSILPGLGLTDAWLEETREAALAMASRVADPALQQEILNQDIPALVAAYRLGGQRAAERFVLRGSKIGDLALDMEASFTEDDLVDEDEE